MYRYNPNVNVNSIRADFKQFYEFKLLQDGCLALIPFDKTNPHILLKKTSANNLLMVASDLSTRFFSSYEKSYKEVNDNILLGLKGLLVE